MSDFSGTFNAQVNLILIGRRAGCAAPYCYVINSVTSLVAVADNVVGLVGKVQLFSCGFNVLLCTLLDRSHSVSKLRVSVLKCGLSNV